MKVDPQNTDFHQAGFGFFDPQVNNTFLNSLRF